MSVQALGSTIASAPRPKGWLERMAAVSPEETRPFLLMLLLSFCLGSSTVFVETAVNALFIARFGAGQLPYVYIVSALVVASAGMGLTRLRFLLPLHRLLGGVILGLFTVTTAIWAGLALAPLGWLIFAGLVWFRFVKAGVELVFWSLANYLFNIQQAKRLFGPISTGDAIAQIIGYLLTPLICGVLGTVNLLYLAAALFGIGAVVVFAIFKERGTTSEPFQPNRSQSQSAPPAPPTRYIALIFGLVTLAFFSFYLIGFIFYSAAGAQFGQDTDGLAAFLGLIFGIAAIISLLAKAFLASRTVQRFGITPNLIIRPLAALLIAAILIGTNFVPVSIGVIFGLTVVLRSLDTVIFNGFYRTASVLLYQPLSIGLRFNVLSLSESVVGPLSIGLVGVMLLVVGESHTQINLFLLVGVCLAWIAIGVGLGRIYPQVLRTSLAKRLLEGVSLTLDDPASIVAVQERLDSPFPGEAIYALDLLERSGATGVNEAVGRLLGHPHPAARREAAMRAERLGLVQLLPTLHRLMADPVLPVRASAIRAVAVLAGDEGMANIDLAGAEIEQDDTALEIQRAALTGLLINGSPAAKTLAAHGLRQLVAGGVEARKVAAAIVGDSRAGAQFPLIQPLLNDPSFAVRRAAILAVERIPLTLFPPGLLDQLIDRSTDPELGVAVQQALSRSGEPVLARLQERFATEQRTQGRVNLARIAGRMEIPAAQAWLADLVDAPNGDLRSVALSALHRQQAHASADMAGRVEAQIRTEVEQAAIVLAGLAALDADDPILYGGLLRLLATIRQRIYWLLGLIYDRAVVNQIQDNLALSSREKRANALELLQVTLRGEVKRLALPLLQPDAPAQQLENLIGMVAVPHLSQLDTIEQLAQNENEPFTPWLQASALYTIGRGKISELGDTVLAALASPDDLVAQTAQWAALTLHLCRNDPASSSAHPSAQERSMLLTIEKAMILRTVRLFETTPDDVLVQAATLLEEVTLAAGQAIFHKGDFGDSMYIIVDGRVRVHDGENLFNYLAERDIFGEMALLDPEPRSASVTAESETHLLKLGREALFELIDARPEVARGIIRGLSHHLRNRIQDIGALQKQLAETKPSSHSS